MSLCKSGQIQNCCQPNALMTLKEYLQDYASEDTIKAGEKLINDELNNIPNEKVKTQRSTVWKKYKTVFVISVSKR